MAVRGERSTVPADYPDMSKVTQNNVGSSISCGRVLVVIKF